MKKLVVTWPDLPILEMIENGGEQVEEVPALSSMLQALRGFRRYLVQTRNIIDQTTTGELDAIIFWVSGRLETVAP